MIIAVVGSGGKTTRIHALAERYRAEGKRVLVTTTTHMLAEPDALLGDDALAIARQLAERGYSMAGTPGPEGKLCPLPEEVLARAAAAADVTLVEADGSRGLPVKYPANWEPVIPPGTERIDVVTGLSALGQPWEKVCHRGELVAQCLGLAPGEKLTPVHLQKLVEAAYVQPLRAKFPGVEVRVCPGQADSLYQRAVAAFLAAEEDVSVLESGWFRAAPPLVICGGGHVAGKLCPLAASLDFPVTVIDDREEFARPSAFPGAAEVRCLDYDRVFEAFPAAPDAFYVIVTRGHGGDLSCLRAALDRESAYVGMIGSRGKVAAAFRALEAEGVPREKLETVHAPIGLAIGAQTPAEIAVSIAAELIAVRSGIPRGTAGADVLGAKPEGVLCIITDKHGSAPRGVGSMMLVTDTGILGTVGGGPVEHAAAEKARQVTGICRERYDLSAAQGGALGMICGGSNEILFIPLYQP